MDPRRSSFSFRLDEVPRNAPPQPPPSAPPSLPVPSAAPPPTTSGPSGSDPTGPPLVRPSFKGTGRGRAVPKKRDRFTCKGCRDKRRACNRKDPCTCYLNFLAILQLNQSSLSEKGQPCIDRGIVCDWDGVKPPIPTAQEAAASGAPASAPTRLSPTGVGSSTSLSSSLASPPLGSVSSAAARILHNRALNDAEAMGSTLAHIERLLAQEDAIQVARSMQATAREQEEEAGGDFYQRFIRDRSVKLDSVDDLASALSTMAVGPAMSSAMHQSSFAPPQGAEAEQEERANPGIREPAVGPFDDMGMKIVEDITFSLAPEDLSRRNRPLDGVDTAEVLFGLGYEDPSVDVLLRFLPPYAEVMTLRDLYEQRVAWLCRLLHGPTFQAQINDIAVRTIADYCMSSASDPAEVPSATIRNLHELAVLFGVLGLAMSICAGTLNPAECQRLGLSQRYIGREERTGQEWLRCALSALRLGQFREKPSLEAIRATVIVVQMPLYASNGESLGEAVAFASQGLVLARKLGLHEDDEEVAQGESAPTILTQDRRRVMYGLLDAVWRMRGLVRLQSDPFSPEKYRVKLPKEVVDAELDRTLDKYSSNSFLNPTRSSANPSAESEFTALNARIQAARCIQEIGLLFADPTKPPTHAQIMDFDRRLRRLESDFPPVCRLRFDEQSYQFSLAPEVDEKFAMDAWAANGTISLANLCLHRGLIIRRDGVPAAELKLHRDRVLHYGLRMMCQEHTGLFPVSHVPIQLFILNAAMTLGVWALTGDVDDPMATRVRQELRYMAELIRPLWRTASIFRRSLLILQHLIQIDERRVEESRKARGPKRARTARGDESVDRERASARQPTLLQTLSSSAGPTVQTTEDELNRRSVKPKPATELMADVARQRRFDQPPNYQFSRSKAQKAHQGPTAPIQPQAPRRAAQQPDPGPSIAHVSHPPRSAQLPQPAPLATTRLSSTVPLHRPQEKPDFVPVPPLSQVPTSIPFTGPFDSHLGTPQPSAPSTTDGHFLPLSAPPVAQDLSRPILQPVQPVQQHIHTHVHHHYVSQAQYERPIRTPSSLLYQPFHPGHYAAGGPGYGPPPAVDWSGPDAFPSGIAMPFDLNFASGAVPYDVGAYMDVPVPLPHGMAEPEPGNDPGSLGGPRA